jgi:trk system potassium uptake protein TrkA
MRVVQELADEITQTVALDATDEDALRAVDIAIYPTVIVAIGADFQSKMRHPPEPVRFPEESLLIG